MTALTNWCALKVMRRVLLCSAGVKPNWICARESVQSQTAWNCHTLSYASVLWRQIKSCLNPNASTARDRISVGCTSVRKDHFEMDCLDHLNSVVKKRRLKCWFDFTDQTISIKLFFFVIAGYVVLSGSPARGHYSGSRKQGGEKKKVGA